MRFMRARERTMPPRAVTQPPTYPWPAPRAVTGILCRWAKRRMAATERVLRGRATASGKPEADHLSPECLWRRSRSNRSSPAGSWRCNAGRVLLGRGLIGGSVGRVNQRPGFRGVFLGHLNADAAGGHRVTVHAQGGEFVDDFGRDVRGVEARSDQLRFGRAETAEHSDELHRRRWGR